MSFWHQDRPDSVHPRRAADPRDNFRRTILFTVAGTLLPGLGLIAAKRRLTGGIILGTFVACILAVATWAVVDLNSLISLAVHPRFLRTLPIVLAGITLIWVSVIVFSHVSLRSLSPRQPHRVVCSILVGALAFAVAAPLAVAARYSYDQAGLVSTVFQTEGKSRSATRPTMRPTNRRDPWAGTPRVNILLLGGDAGADRTGNRTDTVILASIDTHTGDTVMFSLPRNTGRMPFPENSKLHKYYPNGFTNGNGDNAEFFLNSMYDNLPKKVPADVLGPTDNLGADALKLSVGEALGLKVDYYMLINLAGFKKLINALGGITVNINTYIPKGGNSDLHIPPKTYLHPGPNQHLNGGDALWYARGRYGSDDFARMDRQRCVVNAVINQANPANVLARYEAIAKASKDIVRTDIPQEVLPSMVNLSMRVKDGNVRSIVFRHGSDGFSSPDPDFGKMRYRVKVALGEVKKLPSSPKPTTSATSPKKSSSPKKSATPSAKSTTESEDVNDSCAYKPEVAATAQPPR